APSSGDTPSAPIIDLRRRERNPARPARRSPADATAGGAAPGPGRQVACWCTRASTAGGHRGVEKMASMDELRAGVRQSFAPELNAITDADLRDKVVEAWALALSQTEYTSIEAIPGSGGPATPPMKKGTQTEHLRGVARMALGMADALEAVVGPLGI